MRHYYKRNSIRSIFVPDLSGKNHSSRPLKSYTSRRQTIPRTLFTPPSFEFVNTQNKKKKNDTNETLHKVTYMQPLKTGRKLLTENEKLYVIFRQRYCCNMCRTELSIHPSMKLKLFDFDHIVPVCKGGSSEISNIQALCKNCHAFKTGWDNCNRIK